MDLTPRTELDDDAFIEEDELKIRIISTVDRTGGKTRDKEILDKPDAVTETLAEEVWMEESVDVENQGIKVVPDEPGELEDEGDA
jgi:hypothetical protein